MKTVEKAVLCAGVLCSPIFAAMAWDVRRHLAVRSETAPDNTAMFTLVDAALTLAWALGLAVSRSLFYRLLGPWVTRYQKVKPYWSPEVVKSRRERLFSNVYGVLFYTFAFVLGWYVLVDKEWAFSLLVPGAKGSVDKCFTSYWSFKPTWDVRVYYGFGLGHAVHSMMFQLLGKERRRDFFEMMVHHTTTFLLLLLSAYYGHTRIGTLVLLVHDVSDIFICVARAANELKFVSDAGVVAFFLVLNVTWIFYRMWMFPSILIRSTTYSCLEQATLQHVDPSTAGYYVFNGMLYVLFVLHCFWFAMFLKMWRSALIDKKVDDNVAVAGTPASKQPSKKTQ